VTAGLAGVASSKREDWFLSLGRIFQRHRGRDFLRQFAEEWDMYVDKGFIKPGYEDTEQHKVCLQELLDCLDKDSPDKVRFNVLKKIFLTAATEQLSTRESVLPGQFMRICRTLSSGEILVLLAAYRISQGDDWKADKDESARYWLGLVATESGLVYDELVTTYETELIKKNLLTSRVYNDGSGVRLGSHFRMTKFALDLCEYIQKYDATNEPTPANGT